MALTAKDLKPGDRVRFREYEDMLVEYGSVGGVDENTWFVSGMQRLCGNVVTIKKTSKTTNQVWILENETFSYNAAMFEFEEDDKLPDGDFLAILEPVT